MPAGEGGGGGYYDDVRSGMKKDYSVHTYGYRDTYIYMSLQTSTRTPVRFNLTVPFKAMHQVYSFTSGYRGLYY